MSALTLKHALNPKQLFTFGKRNKIVLKCGAERPARIRLSRDEIKKTNEPDAPRYFLDMFSSQCVRQIKNYKSNASNLFIFIFVNN